MVVGPDAQADELEEARVDLRRAGRRGLRRRNRALLDENARLRTEKAQLTGELALAYGRSVAHPARRDRDSRRGGLLAVGLAEDVFDTAGELVDRLVERRRAAG